MVEQAIICTIHNVPFKHFKGPDKKTGEETERWYHQNPDKTWCNTTTPPTVAQKTTPQPAPQPQPVAPQAVPSHSVPIVTQSDKDRSINRAVALKGAVDLLATFSIPPNHFWGAVGAFEMYLEGTMKIDPVVSADFKKWQATALVEKKAVKKGE
jgi:hypothetical protein